jgi:hypothetical protein
MEFDVSMKGCVRQTPQRPRICSESLLSARPCTWLSRLSTLSQATQGSTVILLF